MTALLITDAHLLDPEEGTRDTAPGWLLLRDGIVAERGHGTPPALDDEEVQRLDAHGATAMPGLIDAHVHLMVTSLRLDEIAQGPPGTRASGLCGPPSGCCIAASRRCATWAARTAGSCAPSRRAWCPGRGSSSPGG